MNRRLLVKKHSPAATASQQHWTAVITVLVAVSTGVLAAIQFRTNTKLAEQMNASTIAKQDTDRKLTELEVQSKMNAIVTLQEYTESGNGCSHVESTPIDSSSRPHIMLNQVLVDFREWKKRHALTNYHEVTLLKVLNEGKIPVNDLVLTLRAKTYSQAGHRDKTSWEIDHHGWRKASMRIHVLRPGEAIFVPLSHTKPPAGLSDVTKYDTYYGEVWAYPQSLEWYNPVKKAHENQDLRR